jgi:hypothetical protein
VGVKWERRGNKKYGSTYEESSKYEHNNVFSE